MKLHYPLSKNSTTLCKVDVLETSDVPILFSLSQMNNLGMAIELNPKKTKVSVHFLVWLCWT